MVAVAACRGWAYFDPDYDSLKASLNPPRVVIDNAALPDATLIKLDSTNRHGILIEIVQVFTDLDLFISKAYVSSDGDWFMDVFHLTDRHRNKLTNETTLKRIQESLEKKAGVSLSKPLSTRRSRRNSLSSEREEEESITRVSLGNRAQHTAIELMGADRPGLLSEVFSALTSLNCNISSAEVWTHNLRAACMIFVEMANGTGGPIEDPERILLIKSRLCGIMRADCESRGSSSGSDFVSGLTHTERRLHQMMSADDEDYYRQSHGEVETSTSEAVNGKGRPAVTVRNCVERGYSVVNIQCRDRSKLLFDTVCTLTDMDYMIFHATVLSEGLLAYQEFYIRHVDGCTLETEEERQRLIKRLVAAIERRFPEGLRLELCTSDRVGLLSDVTRVFHRHGLSVTRAYVSTTRCGKVSNTFYVTDASGHKAVDEKTVEAIRAEMGQAVLLQVEEVPICSADGELDHSSSVKFSLGGFLRAHSERLLYNLGLISSTTFQNSCSSLSRTAGAAAL